MSSVNLYSNVVLYFLCLIHIWFLCDLEQDCVSEDADNKCDNEDVNNKYDTTNVQKTPDLFSMYCFPHVKKL